MATSTVHCHALFAGQFHPKGVLKVLSFPGILKGVTEVWVWVWVWGGVECVKGILSCVVVGGGGGLLPQQFGWLLTTID